MTDIKQIVLAIGIGLLLCTHAAAEELPEWPVDYATLESDLIIEGNVKGGRTVAITKVYFGSARIGDEIPVDRLSDFPSVAYEKITWGRQDSDDGIPTKAGRAHNPIGARPGRKCKSQVKVRYSHALNNDSGFRCTCTFDLSPSLLTVSGRAQFILFFVAVEID